MKEFRKGFKRIVSKLYEKKTAYRLKGKNLEEAKKEWRKILSEYKNECMSWKNQCYETLEVDWIYPLKKNIKVSDHPVEICFLIRIMNTIDPERFIEDEVIFHDMPQMAKVLREEKNVNAVELAEHLEMYIGVGEMTEEDFIKIFSLWFFQRMCSKRKKQVKRKYLFLSFWLLYRKRKYYIWFLSDAQFESFSLTY